MNRLHIKDKCEVCCTEEAVFLRRVYRKKSGWDSLCSVNICYSCYNLCTNNEIEGIVVPEYIPIEQVVKYICSKIDKKRKEETSL